MANSPTQQSLYPIARQSVVCGLCAAVIAGIVFFSAAAALAFFVVVVTAGMLWRSDQPPILSFCLAYQWIFIVTGYFYRHLTGSYPGLAYVGNLDGAVVLSLVGLLVFGIGIRSGAHCLRYRTAARAYRLQQLDSLLNLQRLFWLVIATHAVSWLVQISPMEIQFNAAQFIYRILEFRTVLFFLLLLMIVRQQSGYPYGAIAFLFVLIPSLASQMSHFKEVFFLLFLALLSEWRPWSKLAVERLRSLRMVTTGICLAAALLVMGTIWEGGIKPIWRPSITSGLVQGTPMDKVEAGMPIFQQALASLDWLAAANLLAARMSSGAGYFSLVLDQVPRLLPHEDGVLTMRALEHVLKPRFIFPEKINLGSDSWLVRQYAGVYVAGEESGTSVGLGYMAQFYIDFAMPGMFVAIFLYGLIVGLMYQGLLLFSPSYNFYSSAVTIILTQHLVSYEGEIAKLLGGILQAFLVFAAISYIFGPWLIRLLAMPGRPRLMPERVPTR